MSGWARGGLTALALVSWVGGRAVAAEPDGSVIFARCAACHLADGAGVPGVFPAFRGQIGRYAGRPEGREYMVTVVSHGLVGPVVVSGVTYSGFMPAQALSDAEAAAVLNFVVSTVAGAGPRQATFTAAEVAAFRARRAAASAQDARALRPDALAASP